jgi:uncharacterized repeat protein (TIGR01451 family)
VTAGATVSYAITLANSGPSDADGATFSDPAATGLSCTSVSCTGVSGTASCPAAGSVTVAALQGGGNRITPAFPGGQQHHVFSHLWHHRDWRLVQKKASLSPFVLCEMPLVAGMDGFLFLLQNGK